MRLIDSHSHFDAAEFDADRVAAHASGLVNGLRQAVESQTAVRTIRLVTGRIAVADADDFTLSLKGE